jgi:hypothetical protein
MDFNKICKGLELNQKSEEKKKAAGDRFGPARDPAHGPPWTDPEPVQESLSPSPTPGPHTASPSSRQVSLSCTGLPLAVDHHRAQPYS